MTFRIQSYLQFLWHSKNEHGVHSPFVFLLLTQGLYNKKVKLIPDALSNSKGCISKKQQLLYKIIRYFETKSILIIGATSFEKELVAVASPEIIIDIEAHLTHYQCVYFGSNSTYTAVQIEKLLSTVENDSFWILENIHANEVLEASWEALKQNPQVTVTIDTYHFGVVFFRREQEKEHFVIRA